MTPTEPLTAHDRCDRCPAQAQVRAMKRRIPNTLEELEFAPATFLELLFCNHHHRENYERMITEGWTFV